MTYIEPSGGIVIQNEPLAGVSCMYEASRRIAVAVDREFVMKLVGFAGNARSAWLARILQHAFHVRK